MSEYHYDFPFGIMDVAEILDIRIRRKGGRSVYTDCPFCGDTRGKMNLNLAKNVYRCNHCGAYGGTLDLYAKLHNVSTSVANTEIYNILYGDMPKSKFSFIERQRKDNQQLPSNSELASIYDRHQTYETMLSMLTLTQNHKDNLLSRGLTEDAIRTGEYRSTPAFGYDKLVKGLAEKGCTIQGVPGFYEKRNDIWTVNFKSICSGILIPVRTVEGFIQAFQIRLDNPFVDKKGKVTKYIWLSSVDYEKGVSSGGPAHFIGNPNDRVIYITEGPLKADAAHCMSGKSFVAVAGAGNVAPLQEPLRILKENGAKDIYETLDMDKYTNEYVAKAAKSIRNIIKEYGLNPKTMRWNKKYKGVDDYLLSLE